MPRLEQKTTVKPPERHVSFEEQEMDRVPVAATNPYAFATRVFGPNFFRQKSAKESAHDKAEKSMMQTSNPSVSPATSTSSLSDLYAKMIEKLGPGFILSEQAQKRLAAESCAAAPRRF